MFYKALVNKKFDEIKPVIVLGLKNICVGSYDEAETLFSYLKNEIVNFKHKYSSEGEDFHNDIFVFMAYLNFLVHYGKTWKLINNKKFGDSWCSLQDSLDLLRVLKKFGLKTEKYNHLLFFEHQLLNLEKLYPYNVFFSIGAIADEVICSICGKDINTLECPHIMGELYNGVMASGIAKGLTELNHVAMVKHPADKRCVVQYQDTEEQFKFVRFLANSLISKEISPFDFYEIKITDKEIPNPDYIKLRRNEKCFCGSNKKFKNCCINKVTVKGGHISIVPEFRTPEELMT